MSNSIAPGSSADVNVKVTALTTNPNVPVTYKTIILKKNLVNGVNTLTQEMLSATNTKYVVKYDYVLDDDIIVPENCILEFDGGSINGGHTLNLSDNNSLIGNNTIIKALFDSDTCTSNTILNINNINNIHIEGIVFDGDYDGSASASGDYSGHALIKISDSDNIILKNCKIQNWHQSWKSSGEFHVVIAENSSNITFDGITLYNIRPEAPMFQYCSNVIVTNYNTTVNSFWTGLHFFYCNNVILSKSYIQISQVQGSTVNCTAKHVVIENCIFIGGQGLDFSNEGGDQTFDSEDIVVRNCSISNENGYGLYTTPTPHTVKNILIDGCKCITKSFASLQSTFSFTVRNCDIAVTGENDTFVASSKKTGEKYGDYLIENNRITTARILSAPNQDYDEGVSFINNSITVSNFIIHILDTYSYKKVLFVSNEVYGNDGSEFIYVSNGTFKAEQLVIDKNLFKNNINIKLNGVVDQKIVTNNIFNSEVTILNNTIVKNNLWSASETPYTALNLEYGNLENCTIIDNNLGSNIIDFRVTTIGDNFVFNNNIYGVIANYSGKANLLQILDTHKNLNKIVNSGTTANRPTENLYIGYYYFDTSLTPARPIYWNGTAWVDATGATV